MVNDLSYGTRDKRGNWRPDAPIGLSPLTTGALTKLPGFVAGYLFGWNTLYMGIALAYWAWALPETEVMASLEWGWTLRLLALNIAGAALFFGAFELRLYRQRAQERRFKYNGTFPSEKPSDVFWFRSQAWDNAMRSLFVTVPIGTAIMVLVMWLMASGAVPTSDFASNPVWVIALVLFAPILHEGYFFFVHRAIHWEPLYKRVHSVHHNSINPSPWASLSMHPVEATLYYGALVLQLGLFSNPFVVLWLFVLATFGAIVGHIGFDRLELGQERSVTSHAYAHYLHHKYFEVNYCDDGVLPWDQWFGTWHDGTKEADERMKARFRAKREARAQRTGGSAE